jgi:hypothetical protein
LLLELGLFVYDVIIDQVIVVIFIVLTVVLILVIVVIGIVEELIIVLSGLIHFSIFFAAVVTWAEATHRIEHVIRGAIGASLLHSQAAAHLRHGSRLRLAGSSRVMVPRFDFFSRRLAIVHAP